MLIFQGVNSGIVHVSVMLWDSQSGGRLIGFKGQQSGVVVYRMFVGSGPRRTLQVCRVDLSFQEWHPN